MISSRLAIPPLAITYSVGNSFSNIFGGIENIEIANIYCGVGLPNTNLVKNFYQTNENEPITNEYDLTHEVPDGTKAVYTFAVGFKTAEEKDDFVKYLVSYPGYKKLFLKNLDTLEVK